MFLKKPFRVWLTLILVATLALAACNTNNNNGNNNNGENNTGAQEPIPQTGQEATPGEGDIGEPGDAGAPAGEEGLPAGQLTDENMIGAPVYENGAQLATIDGAVNDGVNRYAILNYNNTFVPVPVTALTLDAINNQVVMTPDVQVLDGAPQFNSVAEVDPQSPAFGEVINYWAEAGLVEGTGSGLAEGDAAQATAAPGTTVDPEGVQAGTPVAGTPEAGEVTDPNAAVTPDPLATPMTTEEGDLGAVQEGQQPEGQVLDPCAAHPVSNLFDFNIITEDGMRIGGIDGLVFQRASNSAYARTPPACWMRTPKWTPTW